MNRLQRHLFLSWLAAIAVAVFLGFAYDWPHTWWVTSGLGLLAFIIERPFLHRTYSVAPTPIEFFSEQQAWKHFLVGYGVFLTVGALSLLTFAQGYARSLGEGLLPMFVLVLGPLLFPVAAHQLAVYKALAHADA